MNIPFLQPIYKCTLQSRENEQFLICNCKKYNNCLFVLGLVAKFLVLHLLLCAANNKFLLKLKLEFA